MSDMSPEDDALLTWMVRVFRNGAISDCLVGNDTGCFTPEQYREAYIRHCPGEPEFLDRLNPNWVADHLRSMSHRVEECSPGVWRERGTEEDTR